MSIDFTRGVEIGGASEVPPRKGRRRKESPTETPDVADDGRIEPMDPQGPVVRQNRRKARRGRYAPMADPAPTTTKQGEILNPAVISAPGDSDGIAIGRDRLSKAPVAHDPFTAYRAKRITSPSVVVIGVIGSGKALALDTPIATPEGWSSMGDLQPGDVVFDDQGRPTEVLACSEVMTDKDCYEVEFSDGSVIVAAGDHLWTTVPLRGRISRRRAERLAGGTLVGTPAAIAAAQRRAAAAEPNAVATATEIARTTGMHYTTVKAWLEKAGLPVVRVRCLGPSARTFDAAVASRALGLPSDEVGRPVKTVAELAAAAGKSPRWVGGKLAQASVEPVGRRRVEGPWRTGFPAQEAWTVAAEHLAAPLRGQATKRVPWKVTVTTEEIRRSLTDRGQINHAVAVASALDLPTARSLPIGPYTLGAWLGDGTSANASLTCVDREILDAIRGEGYKVTSVTELRHWITLPDAEEAEGAHGWCRDCGARLPLGSRVNGRRCRACWRRSSLQGRLRELGLLNNKHIPQEYLRAGVAQRRALLAGLLDTDGTASPGGSIDITLANERLARDVRELACSLGYRAAFREGDMRLNGEVVGRAWTVSFTTSDAVFRLPRKQAAQAERTARHNPERVRWRYIVDVRPVAQVPVRCIQVAAESHLFLAGETLVPTHNSTLLKSVYCLRPMILRKRRAVLVDRKDKDGQGEYSELVSRYDGSHFRMRLGGGGDRINPFDPAIVAAVGEAGQVHLIQALVERANNDVPLDEWSRSALREAMATMRRQAEADRRVPLLEDLIKLLGVVDGVAAWSDHSPAALDRMHQAGLGVRKTLEGALADELAGLFDGPTSSSLELNNRITSFDISQLPVEGPATAMVLAVAQAWLLGALRKDRGKGTNFLVEEGWDMVRGSIGKQINANQMLARGLGLCNIAALHHPAQVTADAEAVSLLKEPQTVHIYRQDRAVDVEACTELFNLDPSAAELMTRLEQGSHLLKIGNEPEIHVQHVLTSIEAKLTDTDGAMLMDGGA